MLKGCIEYGNIISFSVKIGLNIIKNISEINIENNKIKNLVLKNFKIITYKLRVFLFTFNIEPWVL